MCIHDVRPDLQVSCDIYDACTQSRTLQTIHDTLNNILKVQKEKID